MEHSAVGYATERSHIPWAVGIGILGAIEAALHVGETEGANQALGDAVALDDGESFILGRDFAAVGELEAAQPHTGMLFLQSQIALLQKHTSGVLLAVIGRVVASAQAQLSQGRGLYRMIRYTQ